MPVGTNVNRSRQISHMEAVSIAKVVPASNLSSRLPSDSSGVRFSRVTEEEFSMTIQVGMVGTDGVVIASDTRWMNTPRYANMTRSTFNTTKILISSDGKIVVSFAKNMETSLHVAQKVISDLTEEDWEHPIFPIEKVAAEVLLSAGERNDAHCLIAHCSSKPRLFLFQYGMMNGSWGPVCQRINTTAIAGDNVNPAIFWAERYYAPLPIQQLVPLAAHLIVSANKLNSGAISGLEMVFCDSSGVRLLSDDAVRDLELQSNKWDQSFGDQVLNYHSPFTYAPL
jgi:hypothetical protein